MRAVNNHQLNNFSILLCIFVSIILLILLLYIFLYRTKSAVIHYEILNLSNTQSVVGRLKRQLIEGCAGHAVCLLSLEAMYQTGLRPAVLLDVLDSISEGAYTSANVFSNTKKNDEKSIVDQSKLALQPQSVVDNFSQIIAHAHLWITTRFAMITPQPYQTIVQGMVLGKGGYLSEHLSHSIETMGIQHIFSVSGANFTVLASMLVLPLQRTPRRKKVLIIAILSIFYTLLVGKQFPVIRACAMYLYNLFGRSYLHKQVQPIFGLVVWVCVVLFWFPKSLESISFQLTVAATLGILISYRPILGLSARFLEGKAVVLQLLDPVLLGIAVFLFVAPVLSLHFAEVSFAGVFYTAALFWFVELISVVGFATLGYICISSILVGTSLLRFSDSFVGLMASFAALPLVSVLQWGVSLPSFSVPVSGVLQLVLWVLAASVGVWRAYAWWVFPSPKSLNISLVQEHYEKNLRTC